MFGISPETIQRGILLTPIFLFALTVHEFFHAWTALKFGDPTAKDLGRLTLNPIVHLDMMGTLMFFISGFRFGWAKPVPVNPFNLRNPRVADIWISAAGPLSNFGLAIIFGSLFRLVEGLGIGIPEMFYLFLYYSVVINISLGFFNLIPLFPLDGSHILRNLMPQKYSNTFDEIERYSPFILLFLVFMGGFRYILSPTISFFVKLITGY